MIPKATSGHQQRPSKASMLRRKPYEEYKKMKIANARATRWRNRRKGVRGDQGEKQNRENPLEIHTIISISTARGASRKMARRGGRNPEVWKGSKTCHFPFIPHVTTCMRAVNRQPCLPREGLVEPSLCSGLP